MTPTELEAEAKALYERSTVVAPRWDQLGDVTKGVWREQVQREHELRQMLE